MQAHGGNLLLLAGALLHLFVTAAAIGKATSGSRSTHGLRATAFRAATHAGAGTVRQHRVLNRQVPTAPLYVPKIGLANVTEPTQFPPPPPALEPWEDNQPADTALGHYLISGFIADPTITPPPLQSSIDLAFACPVLMGWPREVTVSAPDPCRHRDSGAWKNPEIKKGSPGNLLMSWERYCIDTESQWGSTPSATAVTTFMVPNGMPQGPNGTARFDKFGSSRWQKRFGSTYLELRDCAGVPIFTVEERIYKQAGKPDEDACTKYKSCDGVIYFQYFIKNGQGVIVAQTGYLHYFQPSFDVTDPKGVKIASVSRTGWDPVPMPDCTTEPHREWVLKFEKSPPGMWSMAANQWPIAAMMTMLSQRDEFRLPDGDVLTSSCEVAKTFGAVVFGALFCGCCCVLPCFLLMAMGGPIMKKLMEWEHKYFPRRMGKPSQYN